MSALAILLEGGEQTASSPDILPARVADSCVDVSPHEGLFKSDNLIDRSPHQRDARHRVETDEIDTADKSAQQILYFGGMGMTIVEALEYDIFKRDTALARKIMFFYFVNHLLNGVCLLNRHDALALIGERIVQTDSQMTF